MENDKTKELVFAMLMENTGIAMMDSGGGEGRHWQRNAKHNIRTEPDVSLDIPSDSYTLLKDGQFVRRGDSENELYEWLQKNHSYSWDHAFKHEGYSIKYDQAMSDDIGITVSLYHYLPTVLELDEVCDAFNSKFSKMEDWDSDAYGVSGKAYAWLEKKGFTFADSWNTYNGECNLSQTLQGTELKIHGLGTGDYVLLQVHGGADVRGGYTDAKLFKYQAFQEFIDPTPMVWGQIKRGDEIISLQMRESGYGFERENPETGWGGDPVPLEAGDIIEAGLMDR